MNAQLRKFISGDGVPYHNRRNQLESIENPEVVLGSALFRVARRGLAGGSGPASRNSIEVIRVGQFRGEAVEDMRGESTPRQQHNRASGSAPIEDLQLD